MTQMLPTPPSNQHDKSVHKAARAIALLSEGLIESYELMALGGIDASMIAALLQLEPMLDEVRRATTELRFSGEAARLEAARHAREAVQIAASIMKNPDMSPSNRLNAASFIAKASGTERPPVVSAKPAAFCLFSRKQCGPLLISGPFDEISEHQSLDDLDDITTRCRVVCGSVQHCSEALILKRMRRGHEFKCFSKRTPVQM